MPKVKFLDFDNSSKSISVGINKANNYTILFEMHCGLANFSIELSKENAIKFSKSLKTEISNISKLQNVSDLKDRFISMGFNPRAFNRIAHYSRIDLENFIFELENQLIDGRK